MLIFYLPKTDRVVRLDCLNREEQQFHQYQENGQPASNSIGQQSHQNQQKRTVNIKLLHARRLD
jgi:hypothetical protein